jgi:hypothetical protein
MTATTTEKETPRKVNFAFQGDKMVIPENMDLDEAKAAIEAQITEESVKVSINETIEAFPLDGAVAMWKVLQRRYGWTHLKPTVGMFGSLHPPVMVGVEIGFGERIQVPWGNISVPKIEGLLTTSCKWIDGMPYFLLSGTVQRKSERTVAAIAQEIRDEVKKNSIYRAKAVKINFRDQYGDRKEFDFNLCPKFIDMASVGETTPIFTWF